MINISAEEAAKHILQAIEVTREDIARAKTWILTSENCNTSELVDEWLRLQDFTSIAEVNTEAEDCMEDLNCVGRSYSIRLAFYQALWELITSGILVSVNSTGFWTPSLGYRTSHYAGGIPLSEIGCPFPEKIYRMQIAKVQPADVDIFLSGIDRSTLHSGIIEAIDESLTCFRRSLYMPATVMLAAAVEATWTECGRAIAKNLSDAKLSAVISDSFVSISKVVSEVRKTLEHKNAKPLLAKAGLTIHQVADAEIWTTAIRARRNALHWGKSKSFILDHSETGTLLMCAPQHILTLESIRISC